MLSNDRRTPPLPPRPRRWSDPLVLAICAAAAALGGNAWVMHANGAADRALAEKWAASFVAASAGAPQAVLTPAEYTGGSPERRPAPPGEPPVDGSDDLRAYGDPRLGAWANSAVPARFGRFTSGLKVGDAVTDAGATGRSGTWLGDIGLGGPGASWDWMSRARITSLSTNSLIGGTFAARTTAKGKGNPIGLVATAVADGPDSPSAWGIYSETLIGPDGTGGTAGVEFNTVNTSKLGDAGEILPYGTGKRGMTVLNLAAGGDASVHGPTQTLSAFTTFRGNGARAQAGMIFKANALARLGNPETGYGRALVLPQGYGQSWYGSADQAEVFRLYSAITDAGHAQALTFSDDGARFVRGLGEATGLYVPFVADSVNYARLGASVAGRPVEIAARGSDASIDLALDPKGDGVLDIGTEAAPGEITPTHRVLVKFNGVPYYIALDPA